MKSAVSSVGLAVILILLSRYTLTLIGTVQYLIKINQSNDIVIEQKDLIPPIRQKVISCPSTMMLAWLFIVCA